MSTSQEFIEFVCEQIQEIGDTRYKKMFGEYMVYINNKPILLVCDNTVYVKMLEPLKDLMASAPTGYPYEGAKEHYVLDIEDNRLCSAVISILEPITPLPKPRKTKPKTQKKDSTI